MSRLVSARDSAPPLHVRVPPREFDGLPSAGAAPALRTGTQEPEGTDRRCTEDGALGYEVGALSRISKTLAVRACSSETSLNLPLLDTYISASRWMNRLNSRRVLR